MTIWLLPSIVPPRALCHCSLNSYRATLPSQQPRSHASASNDCGVAAGAAAGATFCVAGGAAVCVAVGAVGCVAGGAVVCPSAAKLVSAAATYARTIRSGCLDLFMPIRSSLWPRQRQGQQQVLWLELEPFLAIHGHRQIDRPAGKRRAHVARIGEGELEQTQQAFHALVTDFDAIVEVV